MFFTTTRTSCGCIWERIPGFGDVVVVQCVEHAKQSNSEKSKASARAADRAVDALRKNRK